MVVARRDAYEWDWLLVAIDMALDDPDYIPKLDSSKQDVLRHIQSVVSAALEHHNGEGGWAPIRVQLSEHERDTVNRILIPSIMERVSYPLERFDLLGLYAQDKEHEELRDRILYKTTESQKHRDEKFSVLLGPGDIEWVTGWIEGCTTVDCALR